VHGVVIAAVVIVCWLSSLSIFVFFFSSRRRHTRFKCDWSSDVCSSDLLDQAIVIAANRDIGVLYGAFALLRLIQTDSPLRDLAEIGRASCRERVLDHWDNLDGTVERGYAGPSLWDWAHLPDSIDPRYRDYARPNQSLGINGT